MRVVRFPVVAGVACAVAAVAAVVQYAAPDVVPLLERDRTDLVAGQWWRLLTPVLVQTLGWYQVVANLVALAVVGLVGEWLVRRRWWLTFFASGIVGGQIAAYAGGEPGGGSSIAICGLTGGVLLVLLARARRRTVPLVVAVSVAGYVVALAGLGFGGVPLAIVSSLSFVAMAVLAKAALMLLAPDTAGYAALVTLVVALVVALGLAAVGDLHGLSFAPGIATAAALLAARRFGVRIEPAAEGTASAPAGDADAVTVPAGN